MHWKNKERRSTCRHFRLGKCVYWQTPEKCDFPHRPKHAPRLPPPVENAPPTPPLHRPPHLYPEEATAFVPGYQQHAPIPAAHSFVQWPVIGPSSDNDYYGYHGYGSQYLGYHLNNINPYGQVDFQPYEHPVSSLFGYPSAEHHPVRADCYPEHGIYYYNPMAPVYPESYVIPMDIQFSNDPPQADQYQYQQLYQLPDTPPESRSISPPTPRFIAYSTLPVTDGYAAPPLAEVEQDALVDPEKLKRERSKVCWYGDDCKRPNCYYRHGVVEDKVEGECSGPSSSSSCPSSTLVSAESLDPDIDSSNTVSRKG
ncbi:uncharacterized protein LY79DRAFT_578914 [Colletotrichum navitas]|uniref:C3H1-type domain-containing protein n=1 Tax=Colletotrichum navitas TaxID=681940 RepID=A0AAD8V5Q5_9PEZI|nr:uncharacterized protein LY79DRAFT_578914 [Colletotrichum navitas]KAK1593989.1 hypothetical protein LY79DRAFT_578914 [Colletotrichum navitas]